MRIGSPKPEGTRACASRGRASRPRYRFRRNPVGSDHLVGRRLGRLQVNRPRDLAVGQTQDGLGHAGHARRSQQVPDVGFDGTDDRRGFVPAEEGVHRIEFYLVPKGGAGCMAFDILYALRVNACVGIGPFKGEDLPLRVGAKYRLPLSVVGQPDPEDNGVDPVPVPDRVHVPLQHEHAGPFPGDQSPRTFIQRSARLPFFRVRLEDGKPVMDEQRVCCTHGPGKHQVRLAAQEIVACKLDGIQGRGAGSIKREVNSGQGQGLSNHCRWIPGYPSMVTRRALLGGKRDEPEGVVLQQIPEAGFRGLMIEGKEQTIRGFRRKGQVPENNAGAGQGVRIPPIPAVPQRLSRHVERPLDHIVRLPDTFRGHVESGRVHLEVTYITTLHAVELVRCALAGVVVFPDRDAHLFVRHQGSRIPAFLEVPPERLRRFRFGKQTGKSDNRYLFHCMPYTRLPGVRPPVRSEQGG